MLTERLWRPCSYSLVRYYKRRAKVVACSESSRGQCWPEMKIRQKVWPWGKVIKRASFQCMSTYTEHYQNLYYGLLKINSNALERFQTSLCKFAPPTASTSLTAEAQIPLPATAQFPRASLSTSRALRAEEDKEENQIDPRSSIAADLLEIARYLTTIWHSKTFR